MIKRTMLLLAGCLLTGACFAQTPVAASCRKADSLLELDRYEESYALLKAILPQLSTSDTLYDQVIWNTVVSATELEKRHRDREEFERALPFAEEALKLIRENKSRFDERFAAGEAWMIKNALVSNFALGRTEKARELRAALYQRSGEQSLPKGIDRYYNFDFFKLGDKNVWGYEWYHELPEDRFSSSFTKIVYYVYGTHPDGSDKDQLYRFHVLMFHQDPKGAQFDYILEKQQETEDELISGSYYRYTYRKDVDYLKLRTDIREIILQNIQPDTRRRLSKRK